VSIGASVALLLSLGAPATYASGTWQPTGGNTYKLTWYSDAGGPALYSAFTFPSAVVGAQCGTAGAGMVGTPSGNPDQFACNFTGLGPAGVTSWAATVTLAAPLNCVTDQVTNQVSYDGTNYVNGTNLHAACPLTPPPSTAQCVVPILHGRTTLTAAKQRLVANHCMTGKVKRAKSRTVPKGDVVSLSPTGGTKLAANSDVNITVSRGRH